MISKILAGPILRRTTKNRVCVWLATSESMSLQLSVTNLEDKTLGSSNIEGLFDQRVQMGVQLYVYLLQARSNNSDGFPLDTLMYYKIHQLDDGGNLLPVFSDEEIKAFAYGNHLHPSFFIPSKLKHLLHGSCRKPHGAFDSKSETNMPDALSHGHALLAQTHSDLQQRPSLLLLTGDQIYADDVPISLLALLRQQALVLTGAQETLPVGSAGQSLSTLNPITIPLHGRKAALKDHNSGFSSTASENHLFTFGEFAAMYLYAFGNLAAWVPIWDYATLVSMGVTGEAKEAFEAQIAPLRSFHNTLPDVRKLLANISTYMIFDDHDVTDDWNITGIWYDSVRVSPLGRRIVSNALASYWGFQGWGNDPDNFDKDLVLTITQKLKDQTNSSDIGERYDLHLWKTSRWGFSVPSEPPIIAMDARTQRQYDNKYYPAQLLNRNALDWLRVEWSKLKTGQSIDNNTCPIIIATTPVMGFNIVEFIQRGLLWIVSKVESNPWVQIIERACNKKGWLISWSVNAVDAESWSSNKDGFVAFMDTLTQRLGIARCIFLSGDVHYAFTANAKFTRAGVDLKFWQLTSSSLSNEPSKKQRGFLEKASKHETGKNEMRHLAFRSKNRWHAEVQLLKADHGNCVVAECNLGLVEVEQGIPIRHTLIMNNNKIVYTM